jgi:hypothetical protein
MLHSLVVNLELIREAVIVDDLSEDEATPSVGGALSIAVARH